MMEGTHRNVIHIAVVASVYDLQALPYSAWNKLARIDRFRHRLTACIDQEVLIWMAYVVQTLQGRQAKFDLGTLKAIETVWDRG